MADFKQACKWLKEGKKVTMWSEDSKEEYITTSGNLERIVDEEGTPFNPNLCMLEHNYWEIYEEEDNWNAKENLKEIINKQNVVYIALQKGDLQTLIEKLLQDFKNLPMSSYDDEDIKLIINKRFGDIK